MNTKLNLILLLISFSAISQTFSGEIEYDIKIIPKKKSLNIDSIWALKKGAKAKYLITSNLYKSTYLDNGEQTYVYSYDDISKRMYDEYPDRPYITYRDSRKANFNYDGSEVHKDSVVRIMGRDCFMVKYTSDYGKSTTYYSEDIKVDYEAFKGHKVGNWYEKLKEVDGCIAIKTITEFEEYYEIQEAVRIEPMILTRKDFEITSRKILVASPTALDKPVDLTQPSDQVIRCYQDKLEEGQSLKGNFEKVKCYLSFIVTKSGETKYLEAIESGSPELDQLALEILQNCEFQFIPGEIEGRKVSSLAYFPIEF